MAGNVMSIASEPISMSYFFSPMGMVNRSLLFMAETTAGQTQPFCIRGVSRGQITGRSNSYGVAYNNDANIKLMVGPISSLTNAAQRMLKEETSCSQDLTEMSCCR